LLQNYLNFPKGNKMKRYLDLVFDEDMKTADRGGETIRFTKAERLLLETLTRSRGRVLTRDNLLDAVSGSGSDRSDRNIDYVVNRLRAKLRDDVKSPRYLATRYGEGYVWLPQLEDADLGDAFLVVGPIYGLEAEIFELPVRELVQGFRHVLSGKLHSGRKVVTSPHFEPLPSLPNLDYCIELGFIKDGEAIYGRAILRAAKSWHIIKTHKFILDWPMSGRNDSVMGGLADTVVEEIVFHKSETGTQKTAIPLELSMHEASRLMAIPDTAWLQSGEVLARKRAESPADVKLAIMWASHLYATLIFAPLVGGLGDESRAQTEREIEEICLASLPEAQDNPVLRICIAKLLFFIDRGYLELAESLLRDVFHDDVGFSSVYSLLGQLRAARGMFDEAIRYYDHAFRTAEPGSKYYIYVAVLRLNALLASGQREALDRDAEKLFQLSPETIDSVGLFIGKPDDPFRPHHELYLDSLGSEMSLAMVKYLYNNAARHFVSATHRVRVYAGFASQVERKFRVRFVPPER
jgi:DNA-binding winged helix-turn-helix (wHTH) protein